MDKYNNMLDILNEMQSTMEEMLLSGFNRVHDVTLNELKNCAESFKNYGLKYGADIIKEIYESLEKKQHNFNFDYSECIRKYCILNEYYQVCRERLDIIHVQAEFEKKPADDESDEG